MAPTSINAEANLATAKTVLSTAASVAATVMLVRSIAQDLLPPEIPNYFFSIIGNIFNRFSSKLTVVINEFNGLDSNEIYEAAEVYLATKISPSIQRLKVSKPEKENKFTIAMESNEQASDMFNGVKFDWILVCQQVKSTNGFNHRRDINSTFQSEVRSFELTFHKKHRDLVLNSYLPHIVKEAKSLKQEMKTTKIFTIDYQRMYGNPSDCWISINLDHPSTFETLAMESKTKDFILRDLEQFLGRKEFYKKVGKAWKRGYLLYGPPGTGKSSLIAAMANYLNFNIYDLELTQLDSNDTLRRLLLGMANRSILVVEDIDCTVEFQDRDQQPTRTRSWNGSPQRQVTLSGLLNFIDGLWSSCGDERIIVFTTNQKDKLDSALLRPGRMDVHVHMSYCTPSGFHLLASNYLGIKHHSLFQQIEDSILTVQVTPAEVAEQLLKGGDDCDNTLLGLIEFLEVKKRENKEAEAKKLLLVEAEEADIKEIECKKENEVNSDTNSS